MKRKILLLSLTLHLPLVLMALSLPWHRSTVDKQFVRDISAQLVTHIGEVVDYSKNPPLLTDPDDDERYIKRAVADIDQATEELDKYQHNHATKEDVQTSMTQLVEDLQDIPPAHWPEDDRWKI